MAVDSQKLITTSANLVGDIASVFGIPTNLALQALNGYLARRAREAQSILMQELSRGDISTYQAASEDDAIGVIYSYMLAVRDNAARFNMRLLAQSVAGLLKSDKLYADEFQRYKEVLSRVSRDQALILGRFLKCWDDASKQTQDPEEVERNARESLKNQLVPSEFSTIDHLVAVCASASGLGLLTPASGFGTIVYSPSPFLMEISRIVDFTDAVEVERAASSRKT